MELIELTHKNGRRTLINPDKVSAYIEGEDGNVSIMFNVGDLWNTEIPYKQFVMKISVNLYRIKEEDDIAETRLARGL